MLLFIFFVFLQKAVHIIDQHAKGRRRKIEVPPTDTQPQFELEDIPEDIEKRRGERMERDERIKQEERDRERMEREEERQLRKGRRESAN